MAQQTTSSSNSNHRQIITKGYLMKQGNILNKSFKNKYFILYAGRIFKCFDSDKCLKDNGEIDLSQVSSINYREAKSTSKYTHQFDVITPSKTWTLSTNNISSKTLINEWITHLKESAFGNILFAGWLYKRGGKVQTWKHRYFILSDTKILRYYEDSECTKYKGSVLLIDVIKIQTGDPLQEYDNIIYLTTPQRIWCISAPNKQSQMEWIEKLNDGQNTINYDEKHSIFVGLNNNNNNNRNCKGINQCLAVERIKFVCCIYLKWIKTHIQQQKKKKEDHNKQDITIKRANTTKLKYASISRSSVGISEHNNNKLRSKTVDSAYGVLKLNNQRSLTLRKGMHNIINNDLKEYKNKELLNDFNHILEHHTDGFESFDMLYKYLNDGNHDEKKQNDMDIPPLSVLRTFRNRYIYCDEEYNEEREDLYFNYDDVYEVYTQTILDKIYVYLYYSYDLCKLNKRELNVSNDNDNKMDEYYIDCNEIFISNSKHLLNEKRNKLKKLKDKYKLQLREHKFIGMNMNDSKEDEKELCHMFGNVRFMYWDSCKNKVLYVRNKWKDLKDELLNNNVCNISLPQYDMIYIKVSDLHNTDRALRTGAFSGWKIGSGTQTYVQRYNIKEDTPIKMNHIMACVIYSNYYEFTERYKNTFDINKRVEHSEYSYFSKYLVECITVFGDPLTNKLNNYKNGLYHGIYKDVIILNYLSFKYIKPISFTNSFEIILFSSSAIFVGSFTLFSCDLFGLSGIGGNELSCII
eukprot:438343_1